MPDSQATPDAYHGAFYLTLVSIIQSLALGYLLQVLGAEFMASGSLPLNLVFQGATLLIAVVLVWHQYALGVAGYSWRIDVFDSVIPFLMGISQYAATTSLSIPASGSPLSEVRYQAWLWSVASFAFISVFAYWNQFGKTNRHLTPANLVRMARRSLVQTVGYFVFLVGLALLFSCYEIPPRFNWLFSMVIAVSFLAELVRIEVINRSCQRVLQSDQASPLPPPPSASAT